jgi:hypothetical protein
VLAESSGDAAAPLEAVVVDPAAGVDFAGTLCPALSVVVGVVL